MQDQTKEAACRIKHRGRVIRSFPDLIESIKFEAVLNKLSS